MGLPSVWSSILAYVGRSGGRGVRTDAGQGDGDVVLPALRVGPVDQVPGDRRAGRRTRPRRSARGGARRLGGVVPQAVGADEQPARPGHLDLPDAGARSRGVLAEPPGDRVRLLGGLGLGPRRAAGDHQLRHRVVDGERAARRRRRAAGRRGSRRARRRAPPPSSTTAATNVHDGGLGTSSATVAEMARWPAAAASVNAWVIAAAPALGHAEPSRQRRAAARPSPRGRGQGRDVGVDGVGDAVADDEQRRAVRSAASAIASSLRVCRMPRSQTPATHGRGLLGEVVARARRPWCRTACSSRRRRPPRRTRRRAAGRPSAPSRSSPCTDRAVTALIGLTSSSGFVSVSSAAGDRGAPASRRGVGLPTAWPQASQNCAPGRARPPQCGHIAGGVAAVASHPRTSPQAGCPVDRGGGRLGAVCGHVRVQLRTALARPTISTLVSRSCASRAKRPVARLEPVPQRWLLGLVAGRCAPSPAPSWSRPRARARGSCADSLARS